MGAVDPVADVGSGSQSLKTMEKTGGHVKMSEIFVVQQKRLLPAEGRRVSANIDQHIVYGSVSAADQFGFAPSRTAVHAANHALRRPGLGILKERRRYPWLPKTIVENLSIERPCEQSPLVMERLWDQDQYVGEVGLFDTHMEMLP